MQVSRNDTKDNLTENHHDNNIFPSSQKKKTLLSFIEQLTISLESIGVAYNLLSINYKVAYKL